MRLSHKSAQKNISAEVTGDFKEKIPKFSFRSTAVLQSALEIAMHGCNGALPNQSTYTVAQHKQFSMIKNLFVLIFLRTSVFATFITFLTTVAGFGVAG